MLVFRFIAAGRGAHPGVPLARRAGHPAGRRHDGRQPSVPLLRLPARQGAHTMLEHRLLLASVARCCLATKLRRVLTLLICCLVHSDATNRSRWMNGEINWDPNAADFSVHPQSASNMSMVVGEKQM